MAVCLLWVYPRALAVFTKAQHFLCVDLVTLAGFLCGRRASHGVFVAAHLPPLCFTNGLSFTLCAKGALLVFGEEVDTAWHGFRASVLLMRFKLVE